MPRQRAHVLVIGGGYAGTLAANRLRRRPDLGITLVNPRPEFVERIRLHQFAADTGPATVGYDALLGSGIDLLVDTATRIDTGTRTVHTAGGDELTYDYLVYAVGSTATPGSAVPGAAEFALSPSELGPARRLRAALAGSAAHAPVTVVGAGLTGLETAGELAEQGRTVRLICGGVLGPALSASGRRAVRTRLRRLGGVVPINPRHPLVVASQAQTAHAASHRRFTLGLGLGARDLEEPAFGIRTERPIRRLREYLTVLRSVLTTGTVDFTGETVSAAPPLPAAVAGGDRPDIVVAAMGPQAVAVAGELADGIVPFLAGPRTLGGDIVPRAEGAARAAGRPGPRVIAGVAVVVTDRPERVRTRAGEQMAFYDRIPSYRRVLEREGVATAAELAVIGTAAEVEAQLRRYAEAGATELLVTQTDLGGPEDELATWRFLGALGGVPV
ncbi:TIGR03564 family F420-dependent LLM class oxidoreductase [Nocardia sp. NPDC004568]|uniref:TIGR03564 family F420-dependent LLM class oxidoreductase n=1 Tax=Nocardia sp. NPDC004568 TaxID=3154551 RepID=UPI0033AEC5F3